MLMAYLHPASLLEPEVLLVAVACWWVRTVVRVLANLKTAARLGVHLARNDVVGYPAAVAPVSQQELLIARARSFIVLEQTVPLLTRMIGGLGSALHAEVGLGREVGRAADTILGWPLRMRGVEATAGVHL